MPRWNLSAALKNAKKRPIRIRREWRPYWIEALEVRAVPAGIWDGSGGDFSWNNPLNWDNDLTPGTSADVTINVAADVTISVSGNTTVRSIADTGGLSITGGTFTVTGGSSHIDHGLTVANESALVATGTGTTFVATGATAIDEASLRAQAGASLSLPDLASYARSLAYNRTFEASGSGSELNLGSLRTFVNSGITSELSVSALEGGHIDLHSLSDAAGHTNLRVYYTADGANSEIDLSSLTSLLGNQNDTPNGGSLTVTHGGSVAGDLTAFDHVIVTIDDSATLNTNSWTSFTNSRLTIMGGGRTLTNLANLDQSSVFVSGGAKVSMPALISYEHSAAYGRTFEASGSGSELSLGNLTTLVNSGISSDLSVNALGGGHVDLHSLTNAADQANLHVYLTADGAGSQIDLSALTRDMPASGALTVTNGASVLAGNLTSLDHVSVTLDGTGAFAIEQVTTLTNGGLTVTGGLL